MTQPTDWTPPADPAPAEQPPAVIPVPTTAEQVAAPPVAPPPPVMEVSTGPVAEAPADPSVPVADPTPVAEPAPAVVDPGVSNATPVAADPPAADTTSATPSGPGEVEAPAQVQSASNGPTVTVERSAVTAAAKAFHVLGHLADAAREVQAEIQKFVPREVLDAAEGEALALLRTLL